MIELTITPMEPRENVRAYVYRLLYHNIMAVRLTPGTAVSEQEVSSYLDISRTPVREAFIPGWARGNPAPAGDLCF